MGSHARGVGMFTGRHEIRRRGGCARAGREGLAWWLDVCVDVSCAKGDGAVNGQGGEGWGGEREGLRRWKGRGEGKGEEREGERRGKG